MTSPKFTAADAARLEEALTVRFAPEIAETALEVMPSLLSSWREQEVEIARLREALTPLAKEADDRDGDPETADYKVFVAISHLRRARAVLKEPEHNG